MLKSDGLGKATTIAAGSVLAAALAVLILWEAKPAEATFPGANGKVAFERDGDIVTMNPDGTDQTRLTSDFSLDYAPAWSPDGQQIAFTRYRAIYIMDANPSTDDAINLSTKRGEDRSPDWSPGGGKIAFANKRSAAIFVMNKDGSGQKNLTQDRWGNDGDPAWSPTAGR